MIRATLSFLPEKTRERIFYRFLNPRQHLFRRYFQQARLDCAPQFHMRDLIVGDVISGSIALTGCYEPELSRRINTLARRGGLFVDVGANLGYFSLIWLAGRSDNTVLAIESSPRNQQALELNMQANDVHDRCRLLKCAAGHENRKVTFNTGPAEQTGWGGISPGGSGDDTIEVDMLRLDSVLPDSQISVVKIDVEGADTWVIYGCEELLRKRRIDRIFFEQHDERMAVLGIRPGQAQDFLQRFGYSCQCLGGREWLALAPGLTAES